MRFLSVEDVLALHDRLLDADGGEPGLLHPSAVEAAVVAAKNRAWYEGASVSACAAAVLWHLSSAHAFIDGNKRVAAAAMEAFLLANDASLNAADGEVHDLILRVASGSATRDDVEAWLLPRVG
jgi:death-on-curing protein